LLDDIISALDAHTIKAIVGTLFQGQMTHNRTVILVTHQFKLLVPVASYVVLLDNGDVKYAGSSGGFIEAGHMHHFEDVRSDVDHSVPAQSEPQGERILELPEEVPSLQANTATDHITPTVQVPARTPRKVVEDEARQTGGIARKTWNNYIQAQGSNTFFLTFITVVIIGSCPPLVENLVLNRWSANNSDHQPAGSPTYFITVYAAATMLGTMVSCDCAYFSRQG
jgi:ABC-type multidrug transport system ATPase subunit